VRDDHARAADISYVSHWQQDEGGARALALRAQSDDSVAFEQNALGTVDACRSVEETHHGLMAFESPERPVPRRPRLQPGWTWLWFAFAILAIVLTVIGLVYAGTMRWE
jgi:hypothetical protein